MKSTILVNTLLVLLSFLLLIFLSFYGFFLVLIGSLIFYYIKQRKPKSKDAIPTPVAKKVVYLILFILLLSIMYFTVMVISPTVYATFITKEYQEGPRLGIGFVCVTKNEMAKLAFKDSLDLSLEMIGLGNKPTHGDGISLGKKYKICDKEIEKEYEDEYQKTSSVDISTNLDNDKDQEEESRSVILEIENQNLNLSLYKIPKQEYDNLVANIPNLDDSENPNYDSKNELNMDTLSNIRREETCLILKTDLGEKKFCDVPPPPNSEGIGIVKGYILKNYIERINSYIINITYYERGEYILVNGNSGDQEKILSDHVSFSPSGNYFISTEPNYGYGLVNQGGFMIWKTNNPPMLIVDSSEFELVRDLDNPIWVNDNTILFSRKQYNGDWIYHMMTIQYK